MRRFVIGLLIGLLLVTGCTERRHTPQVMPEWGRAGKVGTASRLTPVGLAVAPSDGADRVRLALAWPKRVGEPVEERVHLLVLAGDGTVIVDRDLAPSIPHLQQVQLVLSPGGKLHLFWTEGPEDARAVWSAPLPDLGEMGSAALTTLEPERLSADGTSVTWHKAVSLPSDDVLTMWLTHDGHLMGRQLGQKCAHELLSDGLQVDFQVDNDGHAHLAWSAHDHPSRVSLYYALLEPDTMKLTAPQSVTSIPLLNNAPRRVLDGPVVSLDRSYIYVSWSQRTEGGSTATRQLHTLAMPSNERLQSEGQDDIAHLAAPIALPLSPIFSAAKRPARGYFAYRYVMGSSGSQNQRAAVRSAPSTVSLQADESVLAVPVFYRTRSREQYQPTLIYLQDGGWNGYQALTWTDDPSVNPSIAADTEHNLYVAWLDRTGTAFDYSVFLASTRPELQASWQHLTFKDYISIAGDLLNRVVSGFVLLPLMVMWLILPFVWLVVMLTRGGDLFGATGRRVLLGALLIYWASKYLLTFQILTYVPGLRHFAPAVGRTLIYVVPLLTLAAAVLVVNVLIHKWGKSTFSVLRTFFLTAMVDVMFSIGVYGIGHFE